MQNKVKIINEDGISQSTKVLNSDGGEIKFITSLNISFGMDNVAKAQIELLMPRVEVFAEAEYIMPELSEYSNDYLHKLNQAISKYLEEKSITNIKYLSKNEINAMAEALPTMKY